MASVVIEKRSELTTVTPMMKQYLEIKADYKIDGKLVIEVSTYVNGLGQCEGYEVYV